MPKFDSLQSFIYALATETLAAIFNGGNYFYHFIGNTGMTLAARCMRHCLGTIPLCDSTARLQEERKADL